MKALRVFIFTIALMLFANAPAFAGAQDFQLVNNTGSTIIHLYCSHADTNSWEEDLLGATGILEPGESGVIRFSSADGAQFWDLRLVFDNGADLYWEDIDLFSTSLIIVNSDGTANFQ